MSILFVVSAPSGTGKSTLLEAVMESDGKLTFSRSYTTRPPRGYEQDGVHYYFTSRENFEGRIAAGEFLEYATVFENYYGTHCSEIDRARAAGRDLIMDIDVQGARQLKSRVKDAVLIFMLPPDRDEQERRLRARQGEKDSEIVRRLAEAKAEAEQFEIYDYIIVNDDLEDAAADLSAIIRAERRRQWRMARKVQSILATF